MHALQNDNNSRSLARMVLALRALDKVAGPGNEQSFTPETATGDAFAFDPARRRQR